MFLQIKQANASLLEPYLGRSEYEHPGQRVVTGQRLMQATNDIFLGYAHSGDHDYFVRQLYDMKGSADLDAIPGPTWCAMPPYAGRCWPAPTPAQATRPQIAGYLGKSDSFVTLILRKIEPVLLFRAK